MRFCLASYRRWAVRPIVATVASDRSRPRHRLALDRGPATLRRPHDQSQQPNRCGEHSRVISRLRTRSASARKSADARRRGVRRGHANERTTLLRDRGPAKVSRRMVRARRASFGALGHPVASPGGAVTLRWPRPHTSPGASTTEQRHRWQSGTAARKRDRPTEAECTRSGCFSLTASGIPRDSRNPQDFRSKPNPETGVQLMSPDGWLMPRKQA